MVFAKRISPADLAATCRMLRVGLSAGLPVVDVFKRQAARGPWSMRSLMGRIASRLAGGDTLADALEPEADRLPRLFVALVGVGEETGHISETFRELEEHYELQATLRRSFRAAMFLPAVNFFGAIGVICLMLLFADILGSKIDPLGIGVGPRAVIKFLVVVGSATGLVYLLYRGMAARVRFLAPVEHVILKLPVLGPALEAVLLSRLSLGLRLTLGAGLPVGKSLRLSVDAAASALYRQAYDKAKVGVRRGEEVHEVLARCGVFPREFVDAVATAEEAGQIPEVMARTAKHYQEEATVRLRVLTQLAAWLVYAAVACMIIYLIFRIFGSVYAPLLEL